jgi:hypothetical protein
MSNGSGIPSGDFNQEPDLERLAEKWYAGAIKSGGLAAALSSVLKPIVGVFAGLLAFLFSILDPIALAFGKAILEGFNKAAGGPMETLLSLALAEFEEAIGGSGGGKFGAGSAAFGIADKFISRIESAAGGPGAFGVEPSLEPAKNFLAMMTEVGLRGWAMDLIAELESFGLIHAFEDLIGVISRTMGFGRLTRVALKPIIDATIGQAALAKVNLDYRPKLLSEGLAVKQVIRGLKDAGWLDQELGRQGYSSDRIEAILADARKYLPIADAANLERHGIFTEAEFDTDATNQGYTGPDASLLRTASALSIEDSLHTKILDVALQQLHDGIIDEAQFVGMVSDLKVPIGEAAAWGEIARLKLTLPRRTLTVLELKDCLKRNLIALDEFRQRLEGLGFSAEDATLLELLEHATLTDAAAAKQAKADIAAQKAAAKAAAAAAKVTAAAEKAAALAKKKADAAAFIAQKQAAAEQAHIDRIKLTEQALVEHEQLIADAHAQKLITDQQAVVARAQLTTVQQQHTAQVTAAAASRAATVAEQNTIDGLAVQEKITAEKVAATTKAAKARADLDQQLLDARQADRVAGFQLARQSAQDSFDAGEITAAALSKKLRAIDLQEKKAIAAEDVTKLQTTRAQQAAESAAAKGQIALDALAAKPTTLPAATQRRQDAIAATLADHVSAIAAAGTAKTTALSTLASTRVQQLDAQNTARAQLDQQLADARIALEQQIAANKPKPPA